MFDARAKCKFYGRVKMVKVPAMQLLTLAASRAKHGVGHVTQTVFTECLRKLAR